MTHTHTRRSPHRHTKHDHCGMCDGTTLPQTVLEAIRRYEHRSNIPRNQRLDPQPCEVGEA